MKLYAFQPNNCGLYSFFVMADSESEAVKAVLRYIKENNISNDDYLGFYKVKELDKDEVITNNHENLHR